MSKGVPIIGKSDDNKAKIVKVDDQGRIIFSSDINIGEVEQGGLGSNQEPWEVKQTGSIVEEQLTDDDADENNILDFSDDIVAIEIYHNENELQEFEVNGITLKIASGGWRSRVGGTPSNEVEIPDDIECTVGRLK